MNGGGTVMLKISPQHKTNQSNSPTAEEEQEPWERIVVAGVEMRWLEEARYSKSESKAEEERQRRVRRTPVPE